LIRDLSEFLWEFGGFARAFAKLLELGADLP